MTSTSKETYLKTVKQWTVKTTKEPVEADLLAEDECGGGEERGDQPDAQQRAQGEAAAALPSQGGHDYLLIISKIHRVPFSI